MEPDGLTIDDAPADVDFTPLGDGQVVLIVDGHSRSAVVEPDGPGRYRVTIGGRTVAVRVKDEQELMLERLGMHEGGETAEREVRAPMPGLVLSVLVEPGQQIAAGDGLLVLEAMKMENELRAPAEGVVQTVHVEAGDAVGKNALLIEMEG